MATTLPHWQVVGFWWGAVILQVTQPVDHVFTWGYVRNKKPCISTSTRPVVTKIYGMVAYDNEP